MDKLTNPHVREAVRETAREAEECGVRMRHLCWGEKYAVRKLEELTGILYSSGEGITEKSLGASDRDGEDVFRKVRRVSELMSDRGIPYDSSWPEDGKGIDDYLLRHKRK